MKRTIKRWLVTGLLMANFLAPAVTFAGVYHGNIRAAISDLNDAIYRLTIAHQPGMFDGHRLNAIYYSYLALGEAYAADAVPPSW